MKLYFTFFLMLICMPLAHASSLSNQESMNAVPKDEHYKACGHAEYVRLLNELNLCKIIYNKYCPALCMNQQLKVQECIRNLIREEK